MIDTMKKDDLVRMLVTLWAIWHAKRKAIPEEIFQSPLSTICFVDRFLEDLTGVQETGKGQRGSCPARTIRNGWIAPPTGLSKVNVDSEVAKSTAR